MCIKTCSVKYVILLILICFLKEMKMEKDFKNKVVVVTGGADGIGYQIVEHFLEQKPKIVIILDINQAKGEEAKARLILKHGHGQVEFIKCDVTTDLEEVSKKIFDEYKHVDVLVNDAGIVDEKSARRTMEVNAIAVIDWTMKFWEHMRTDKGGFGGTVLNIASVYGYAVDPYLAFYKASKFAVMGFTRTLGHAQNFAMFDVRLIVLCPGLTHTSLIEKQLVWDEHVDDFNEFAARQKSQTPQDVGKAAVDIFKVANSGSAWSIIGGILKQIS